MSFTRTEKIRLWDGVDTADLRGVRTLEGVDDEIELIAIGTTDNFDDGSIDTDMWGTAVAAGGTIVESGGVITLTTTSTVQGTILYRKEVIDRAEIKSYRMKMKVTASSFYSICLFGLIQRATAPVPDTSTIINPQERVLVYTAGSGTNFNVFYMKTDDTLMYWNGSIWTATPSTAYSLALGTYHQITLESNGTQFKFIIENADASAVITETAWVDWSAVKDDSADEYICFGDLLTSHYTCTYVCDFYTDEAYPTTSPSPAAVWEAFPVGSVIDMSTARVLMFKDGVIQAATNTDVQLKYASNGGSLGSTITLTAFRAVSDITVTDAVESLKVVGVYASDGSYKSASDAYLFVDVAHSSAGSRRGIRSIGV